MVLNIPPGLESLLPRFIAEMVADGALVERLAGGDRRVLAEHVHAMRGKCSMFGAEGLFALLSELERMAPLGPREEIDRMVDRIGAMVEALRGAENLWPGGTP